MAKAKIASSEKWASFVNSGSKLWELFRSWPESNRLTYISFENTTATVNTVIYGVLQLVAHRLSPLVNLRWGSVRVELQDLRSACP